jgi:GNAT superfamily N-acetyltransferase
MGTAWSLRYRVRRAHGGDARVVLEIFLASLREHGFHDGEWNVNAEMKDFGASGDEARDDFVAVSGTKVCGFLVLLRRSERWGEISKIFVHSSHRARGVGTMLLECGFEAARERGYRELMLETHAAFAGARRYYESHGWTLWPSVEETATRMYSIRISAARPAKLEGESGVVARIRARHRQAG